MPNKYSELNIDGIQLKEPHLVYSFFEAKFVSNTSDINTLKYNHV